MSYVSRAMEEDTSQLFGQILLWRARKMRRRIHVICIQSNGGGYMSYVCHIALESAQRASARERHRVRGKERESMRTCRMRRRIHVI